MRKRHGVGGMVAVTALAATAIAGGMTADTAEAEAAPTSSAPAQHTHFEAATVLLPTGDLVTVSPDGTAGIRPAPGREDIGFLTVPVPGAPEETLVIPHDMAEEIRSGRVDARRYNTSRPWPRPGTPTQLMSARPI